jgi:enamine deaminase RidA (YjgF/YER057c/UK114 family)
VKQALINVDEALKEAGASISDVVRVRYILPDRADFPMCWPTLRSWFGDVRPAATMIQAGLMEEAMRFEIEVTAKKLSVEKE